jgi:GTPase SAR1 family protein
LIGNKIDRESERKVMTAKGEQWGKQNNDIPYYETSAKDNISVDEAFVEMAKIALKRENSNSIIMPDTIGGAGGAIRLNPREESKSRENKKKKKCDC